MSFFKKGPLSNRDFKKEFGKNIFIYPFKEQNLKGSTYNLTASICAWIVEKDGAGKTNKLIVDENGDITIPAGKTAIIETEESLYVTGKISGTYNSKVKLCSKGLEHIGTTLDPFYFGSSAIPIHNDTNEDIKLKKNSTIVSIMFFYTNSKADNLHDNSPFRNDIFGSFDINSFYDDPKNKAIQEKTDAAGTDKENTEDTGATEIINKRKALLQNIENWRDCSWRNNRLDLERQVKKYIKKNDCLKILFKRVRITIYLLILFCVVCVWIMLANDKNENIYDITKTLLAVSVPSAALIIGVIYKSYESNKNIGID